MKKESKILTAFIAVSMAVMTSCGSDNNSTASTGNETNPTNIPTQAQQESQAENNSIVISADLKQSEVKVGDIVVFGDYTWNVINETDDGYTLLCENCITQKAYDTDGHSRWSGSSLRAWLNNDFYNELSNEEKAMIKRTHISKTDNSANTLLSPNSDYDTWDFIFLLSHDEAEQVNENVRAEGSSWWLRTLKGSDAVEVVREDGSISSDLIEFGWGVRPALNLTRKSQQDQQEEILNNLMNSAEGDVVIFGAYTWTVTNQSEGGCTLLNENSVAWKAYNDNNEPITWAECTLRTWLNNYFYNEFSDAEKAMIKLTQNNNPNNRSETNGGVDTDDYIFLFSVDEATDVIERINVRGKGLLRSPGYESNQVMTWGNGISGMISVSVEQKNGVCPALNIKYST